MPFTLAHPALVVPLARRFPHQLVFPALVIGSMAPDFEFFVYLRTARTIGHDLDGIVLMCVPSGLLALWLFEHLAKRPMVLLLPRPLRRRLLPLSEPVRFRPPEQLLRIVISLEIGALSHLAWDSLTHADGWAAGMMPDLAMPLGWGLTGCVVLQYASTALGIALLAAWGRSWLRRQRPAPEDAPSPLGEGSRRAILSALIIAPALGGPALTLVTCHPLSAFRPHELIVRSVLASISMFILAALAYSAAYRAIATRR
jgi:hypothetical protein